MPTIDDRARARGLRSYDTALPQDWRAAFLAATGLDPVGRIVWCYDGAGLFGAPVALDPEAEAALDHFRRSDT